MFKKMLLIITCFTIVFSLPLSSFAENQRQHYVKIKYDDKVLFHEKVPDESLIQVNNADDEIIESIVLKQENTIELEEPNTPKEYMLSYWDIKKETGFLIIKPVLTKVKKVNITFNALDGGNLIENNAQTKVITKSSNKETPLKEIIPKTNPEKNYKFSGWYLKNDDKEFEELKKEIDTLKVSNDEEYYALFYPDLNDNEIDDRSEKINVKFIYNDDKSDKKSISLGKSIKVPKPKRKGYIFMGWFYDKNFKEKYNNQDKLINDTVLYAKWEKAEKIIKESERNPITEKNVSDQVEKYLKNNPPIKSDNKKATDQRITSNDNFKEQNKNDENLEFRENEPTNNPTVSNNNQNNKENDNENSDSNEVLKYTEEKYVFKNDNIDERHMVKFINENGAFIFSLTLPYGRTIHLLNEKEKIIKEYAVRQDTTITLKTKDYFNPKNDSKLIGFDSRTIQENNSYITEIYPEIRHSKPNEVSISDETATEKDNNSNIITIVAIISIAISIIGLASYFILKKRRKNNSDVINVN